MQTLAVPPVAGSFLPEGEPSTPGCTHGGPAITHSPTDSFAPLCSGDPTTWDQAKGGTRRQRVRAEALDQRAGEDAEEAERQRWLEELVAGLREMRAPVVGAAEATGSPEAALCSVAAGARAATWRQRVRECLRLRAFMLVRSGTVHRPTEHELTDYLMARWQRAMRHNHAPQFVDCNALD